MALNITFIVLFVLSLVVMWLGTIFTFAWHKMLTRRIALVSLLVCIVLAFLIAGILTVVIDDMGLLLKITL